MKAKVNKVNIRIIQENLLAAPVSGIVLATDPNLSLSADVTARAGPEVVEACQEIGWCAVGSAAITTAGRLPFEKLIHAVAPRWGEGSERGKLANLTLKCLRLAEDHQLKSVAFPALSTGAMGYPMESCARILLEEIIDFTFEDLRHLRTIMVCLDNALALDVFNAEFARLLRVLQTNGNGKVKV
jgi:O-acetyl-ADP-ribose deacetylase (regulator of RNase III)